MRFPDAFVSDLVSRCDIVDIISKYITLRRRGTRYMGLCPFHGEKTPSFSVSQDKQLFYCFGCGVGGDVISFIMKAETLNFNESVRWMANHLGVPVPDMADDYTSARRGRILEANRAAARWFFGNMNSPLALGYVSGRGLTPKTVKKFGIGYAPDSWDALISELESQGFEKSEITDAGLASAGKSGGIYDRFRNRIMFPILDVRGQVIAFGGRALDDKGAKYLNSPETPVFTKGRHLFALNLAKKSGSGMLVLTEGYMDAVAMHQAGIDCAVASLGTALTPRQAALMKRFADRVVIAYDSDEAGKTAANRAIDVLIQNNLNVKVLKIEKAKDPDQYIREFGADSFRERLDKAAGYMEYRLSELAIQFNMGADEERVEFVRRAVLLLAGLESPAEAEVYTARAASMAGIEARVMDIEVKRERSARLKAAVKKESGKTPAQTFAPRSRKLRYENMGSARSEEELVSLLAADQSLVPLAAELSPPDFSSELLGSFFSKLRAGFDAGVNVPFSGMAGEFTQEEMSHLSSILSRQRSVGDARRFVLEYVQAIRLEAAMRDARSDGSRESLLHISEEMRRKKGSGGSYEQ